MSVHKHVSIIEVKDPGEEACESQQDYDKQIGDQGVEERRQFPLRYDPNFTHSLLPYLHPRSIRGIHLQVVFPCRSFQAKTISVQHKD